MCYQEKQFKESIIRKEEEEELSTDDDQVEESSEQSESKDQPSMDETKRSRILWFKVMFS